MPNWCQNRLSLIGTNKELKRFKTEAKSTEDCGVLSFNSLMPTSKDGSYNRAKSIEMWGCKWDLFSADYWDIDTAEEGNDNDEGEIRIMFDTAWSPPDGVVRQIVKDFKLDVSLVYCEHDCDLSGYMRSTNGVIDEQSSDGYVHCNCEPYEEEGEEDEER